jgi:O-antigen chain-terminating methyltransferase
LRTANDHRLALLEESFRGQVRSQHSEFTGALERSIVEIQKRLWADLERIRVEYESLIHVELRTVRQRAALLGPPPPAAASGGVPVEPQFDYLKFAEKFRGPEEYVREGQRYYIEKFRGCTSVLDVGCGRGEFLELMKEAGIAARGVDSNPELVALCRNKGLEAETGDMFSYLDALPDQSIDGLFCAQVVEHLPPALVPELVRLAQNKLRKNGVLAIETPNPECLAIFATHFYLDPTHTRPIPPALLAFYAEENGFGQIEIRRFAPAWESMPEVKSLPEDVREKFFGSLDYAVLARRL